MGLMVGLSEYGTGVLVGIEQLTSREAHPLCSMCSDKSKHLINNLITKNYEKDMLNAGSSVLPC